MGIFKIRSTLPDGTVHEDVAHNMVTNLGVVEMLDRIIRGSTEYPVRIGFVDYAGWTTGYDKSDRIGSHPGWQEVYAFDPPDRDSFADRGVIVAADYLSAQQDNEVDLVSTAPMTTRGLFVYPRYSSELWGMADFSAGPVTYPVGTRIQLNYFVTIYSA